LGRTFVEFFGLHFVKDKSIVCVFPIFINISMRGEMSNFLKTKTEILITTIFCKLKPNNLVYIVM